MKDASRPTGGSTPSGSTDWGRTAIGVLIGGVAGYFVGTVFLRWVATLGTENGWEDLIAIVLSMMSFGPVGAIAGGLIGFRRDGQSLWSTMSHGRRVTTLTGAAVVAIGGAIFGAVRMDDPMSATFLAVWGLVVGAVIGYWLGRGRSDDDDDDLSHPAGLVQPPVG